EQVKLVLESLTSDTEDTPVLEPELEPGSDDLSGVRRSQRRAKRQARTAAPPPQQILAELERLAEFMAKLSPDDAIDRAENIRTLGRHLLRLIKQLRRNLGE